MLVAEEGRMTWWTFAGQKTNATLAPALASLTHVSTTSDNLAIEFERALPLEAVQQTIEELGTRDPGELLPAVSPEALVFHLQPERGIAQNLVRCLREQGILMLASGPSTIRAVTHLNVTSP